MGPFGSNIKVDSFVDEGIPVFSGSNLTGFDTNDTSLRFVTPEKAESLGRSVASRGDIVVTHRGTLGQIAYIPYNSLYEHYVISQSQFRMRLNEKVLPAYLVYYFHTPLGQWKILSNKTQAGVPALGRPTSTFQKIEVVLPNIEVQTRIVRLIDSLESMMELNRRTNDYFTYGDYVLNTKTKVTHKRDDPSAATVGWNHREDAYFAIVAELKERGYRVKGDD